MWIAFGDPVWTMQHLCGITRYGPHLSDCFCCFEWVCVSWPKNARVSIGEMKIDWLVVCVDCVSFPVSNERRFHL